MMNWDQLITAKRLGVEYPADGTGEEERSQFQRDYDRIIFSPAFRRMQNKTQVFPLPGRIFVHNRLTHSLEVASVGRSLGNRLAETLFNRQMITDPAWLTGIGSAVSAACLAHDMGNPPFGHSGEAAISSFFVSSHGQELKPHFTAPGWKDYTHFDGNANAFRLLTHPFKGKRPGGFALTVTTLAGIVKYPYESHMATRQKFGFFQSEKETYRTIASETGLPLKNGDPLTGVRHPLVYLVEAADDICYQIMDVEDAFKLGILGYEQTRELFLAFYDTSCEKVRETIARTLEKVSDPNEQISFLRAGAIGRLITACANAFFSNYNDIMAGEMAGPLLKKIAPPLLQAMKTIQEISLSRIYNHRTVVEIEIAGYKIIGTLLTEFTGAMLDPASGYSRKILSLMPAQYEPNDPSIYSKVQAVVDFISGMTDVYALDLYRKITGITLPDIA